MAAAVDHGTSQTVLELTGESTPIRTLLHDLWHHRGLLPMLAAKDFHARYRSASLGVLWSVFLPLLQGAVFAVVFTRVVRVPIARGTSYPVFVISGMVLWSYFSQSVMAGSTSIVDGGAIAGKVYFPRSILPAVPAVANAVSFSISGLMLLGLMVVFDVGFGPTLLLLPVAMLLLGVLAALLAALLTLLHVYFRDVRYAVQASLLVALYASPVIYPLQQAEGLQPIVLANPATGALQLARYAIFGEAHRVGTALLVSAGWIVALVVAALFAYRRHERIAVDRL
ncbi:MAG: ABC transporter permease [Acidimicrobiales bacterium]